MAIFHIATNTPPKSEIIGDWLGRQAWGPSPGAAVELVGSFHLDDPEGEVGMQVFVVSSASALFQVPLTYRAEPLPGADASLLAPMEHSVLGTRYVYDGIGDYRFLSVLAGVTVSGYGQALGFAQHEGRWYSVPDELIVHGGRPAAGRLPVDGFTISSTTPDDVVLGNDRIEMTVHRRLTDRPAAAIGLCATWSGQPDPVSLVEAREIG